MPKSKGDSGFIRRWFALERLDLKDTSQIVQILHSLPRDFYDTLRMLREINHLTQDNMGERMMISCTAYRNLESGKIKHITAETVIAICIAMNLDFELSMGLFEKSGQSGIFLMKDTKSVAYRKILYNNGKHSLREVNDALTEMGIEPLRIERIK